MEISQAEIIQRKREIDELAGLHRLEEWQKDRLFQEYVRRKSMGYEISLLEIAKEWGWIDEVATAENDELQVAALPESQPVVVETPKIDDRTLTEETLPQPEIVEQTQEQLPTQEVSSQETMQPTPVEVPIQPEQQPQVEQIAQPMPEQIYPQVTQHPDFAEDYNKDAVVGYKLPSGIYNDPEKIAQQAKGGALEEASTWISTKLSQLFGISSAA